MTLDEILAITAPGTHDEFAELATPFELWCEQMGVHPETHGAWEAYAAHSREGLPRSR